MPEVRESKKPSSCKKKSTTTRSIKKNIFETRELIKYDLNRKKPTTVTSLRSNVLGPMNRKKI